MVQRFLLDTHTLIWALDGGERLSAAVNDAITDPDNAVFVSVVSAWEMAIKRAIGKLDTPDDLAGAVAAWALTSCWSPFGTRNGPGGCRCCTATRSTGCW